MLKFRHRLVCLFQKSLAPQAAERQPMSMPSVRHAVKQDMLEHVTFNL